MVSEMTPVNALISREVQILVNDKLNLAHTNMTPLHEETSSFLHITNTNDLSVQKISRI